MIGTGRRDTAFLCGAAGLVLVACSTTAPTDADVGAPRDATLLDSTLAADVMIDASRDGGGDADASHACAGGCDPTSTASCGAQMQCTFAHGVTVCASGSDATLAGPGAHCTTEDGCAASLACFATATAGVGMCGSVCCPGADQCPSTQRCRGDGTLVDGQSTVWARCLSPIGCDLAHPEHNCVPREGCYIVDSSGRTECLIAGTITGGSPCQAPDDCVPGYVCAGLASRTCTQICFLSSTAPHQGCDATSRCEAQAYSPTGTGICVPM